MRQCMLPYIYVAEAAKSARIHGKVTLFASRQQRAMLPGAAQKGKECPK